jgi:transposase-like protein
MSKSAEIRTYLEKHPTAAVKDVADKFGVQPSLVYTIRSATKRTTPPSPTATGITVETIETVRKLADQVGHDNLRRLIDVLAD